MESVKIEEVTGEVYLEKDELALSAAHVRATHKRLGNMALITALNEQVSHILGENGRPSLLLCKVLYNGTHGDDIISKDDVLSLKAELALVRGLAGLCASSGLQNFLSDMEDLVASSESQGNPIVFI